MCKILEEMCEEVRQETTEIVTKEVTERVRRDVEERIRRETAEKVSRQVHLGAASRLLQMNCLSFEQIAQVTKLSMDEIKALAAGAMA